MSFQEFYLQSRLHALESTLQQVCIHLDYMNNSSNQLSNLSFNLISSPLDILFSIIKGIILIGIIIYALFDFVIGNCSFHTAIIETEIIDNHGDNNINKNIESIEKDRQKASDINDDVIGKE